MFGKCWATSLLLKELHTSGRARLLAQQGRVLRDYGGVISSLDWIYSPRGDDGRPMQLFDRDTGTVNQEVAAAWLRYDLAGIIRSDADRLRPLLDAKIRLIVGVHLS